MTPRPHPCAHVSPPSCHVTFGPRRVQLIKKIIMNLVCSEVPTEDAACAWWHLPVLCFVSPPAPVFRDRPGGWDTGLEAEV